MKLLRNLDIRPLGSYRVRYALFECPFCGTQQELRKTTGLLKHSCGCVRGLNSGKDQGSFWSEVEQAKERGKTESNDFLEILKVLKLREDCPLEELLRATPDGENHHQHQPEEKGKSDEA